ncbi:unnamed protein product, partial [Brenthis ino]
MTNTDHKIQRCGSDDYAWCGGAARQAGLVSTCRAVRGVRGAVGAAAHEPRLPRPAPPARPPPSARTSAPLPPRHVARRSARPPRRLRPSEIHRRATRLVTSFHTRVSTRSGTDTPVRSTLAPSQRRAHYMLVDGVALSDSMLTAKEMYIF